MSSGFLAQFYLIIRVRLAFTIPSFLSLSCFSFLSVSLAHTYIWMVQHDLCEDLVPMKATGAEQLAKRAETQKKKIAELEHVCGCARERI